MANPQEWLTLFYYQILQTSIIEWLAVIFGTLQVFLAKNNNIWLYPTGIISILLSIYLMLNVGLYAETLLSAYYLVMSVYGWYLWVNKSTKPQVEISWTTKKELIIAILISTIGYVILYTVLVNFTDSNVPVEDAFVSSTAWAGMWLLAKRKIENWIFLNISNLVAIPLLIYKQLPMMALLTLILFIVAIFGFFDWKKIYNRKVNTLTV